MLSDSDILDYVKLCRLVGADFQLIQGTGGNISVKSGDEIIIKSSGKRLADTTPTSAYVICSIQKAQEIINQNSTEFLKSVLKGDINTPPSMELSFHLLPYKYIVHMHPLFLLPQLCSAGWKTLTLTKYSHTHIEYKTPGTELGNAILQSPLHQVYFLQNHGIILCADTEKQILEMIEQLYTQYLFNYDTEKQISTFFKLYNLFNQSTKYPHFIKKCEHIHTFYERLFFPFTPDIHLFLKEDPLFQELACESIEKLFDKYVSKHSYSPAVVRTPIGVYVIGKNFQHCQIIEEMLESYLQIHKSSQQMNLQGLTVKNTDSLQKSEQEKHRLQVVG